MNKNTNFFQYTPVFFSGILIFFYMSFGQNKGSIESLVSRINILNEKIDSLDMEKQKLKRKGLSIDEPEKLTALLRDSLYQTRNKIEKKVSETPDLVKKLPIYSSLMPQNYLDWIIIITGILAVFSGIILIFGIIKTIKNKPRKTVKKQQLTHPLKTAKKEAELISKIPDQPLNGLQESENSSRSKKVSENPVTKIWGKPPINSPEIENLILKAHNNGMNISDISRKFQLSSDYVSLILKVAKKQ